MNDYAAEHRLIRELFLAGLHAVEPRAATKRALGELTFEPQGRLIVIAIGKAAATMARGAHEALGARIDAGIVLTKDGHLAGDLPGFHQFEARHPLPDQRGIAATRAILSLVERLDARDTVIALISGGGSALLEAPVPPITLDDFQRLTDLLLRAGAPIQHLNTVRRAVSEVKGGGLRRAIGPARCVSLILSDVLGNDPAVIASGPTVPGTPDRDLALQVVRQYRVETSLPASVRRVLAAPVDLAPFDTGRDVWRIIADNSLLLEAVAAEGTRRGLRPAIIWRNKEGEASDLGAVFAHLPFSDDVDLLIGGGETTVTVRGNGTGGRNTEFALAAAIAGTDRIVASLGSDGQDGLSDAAGAIVDPGTVQRGEAAGLSARLALEENDSATFLDGAGGLVRTGPTGTNVNDIYLALRPRSGREPQQEGSSQT